MWRQNQSQAKKKKPNPKKPAENICINLDKIYS